MGCNLSLSLVLQMIDTLRIKPIKPNIDSLTYLTNKKKKEKKIQSNCRVNPTLETEAQSIHSD